MAKRLLIVGIAAAIVVIGGGLYLFIGMPSKETIDPIEYFSEFREGQTNVTLEDLRINMEEPVFIKDGLIYVSNEFAKLHVDDAIYYDAHEDILTITNMQQVIRMNINDPTYLINNGESSLDHEIFEHNDRAYIPETYLEEHYPVEFTMGKDERIVKVSDLKVAKRLGVSIDKEAIIRTHPTKQSAIVDVVPEYSEVEIYSEGEDYYRVRNENGMIGYIEKKHVELADVTETQATVVYEPYPIKKPLWSKVRMVWDQMASSAVHSLSASKYSNLDEVNVISPTWFEFSDEDGNLTNRASSSYVREAYSKGLLVWPLMSHSFLNSGWTRDILTSTAKRQHVIDQLIEFAQIYGFDGINIDIENVATDFSEDWVQFMRELYPQLSKLGLTVSVDIYIPSAWSSHYKRDKIAEVVDYFMVMAYDQHWSGSEEPGPVAAIPWVEEGIVLNLEEVPNNKLVLGIPFYNRIWAITDTGLETIAVSMSEVNSRVNNAGATPIFDALTQLNYAHYEYSNKSYHIWIEDKDAVAKRVELMNKYDLAGYACWKLGLETNDVWNELSKLEG